MQSLGQDLKRFIIASSNNNTTSMSKPLRLLDKYALVPAHDRLAANNLRPQTPKPNLPCLS